MNRLQFILLAAAGLHLLFTLGEMLPWHLPFVLQRVILKKRVTLAGDQLKLTATIVHNAAIYNLILAIGFLWSAFPGALGPAMDSGSIAALRCFLLAGAVLAGAFGLTLSPVTLVQAVVGILGLLALATA